MEPAIQAKASSKGRGYRPVRQSLDQIMQYSNDRLIKRFVESHGGTEASARRRFEALKQFMYICAAVPGYKVTSDAIDDMWHTFLLFTKEYRSFCDERLGRFINHEPFENPAYGVYLETRAVAEELFGTLDPELWPLEAKPECTSGCND